MPYRKYRWSKDYEAAEEELEILLNSTAKSSVRCELPSHQSLSKADSDGLLRLWCAEGSIIFVVDNQKVSLQPGDTLDLSEDAKFDATAGIAGCVFYKALA